MRTGVILYPTMILYSVGLHLAWGVLGLINESAFQSTAASAIFRVFGSYAPWACITVGLLALWGLRETMRPLWGLTLMLPQQTLLMISAFGVAHAIAISQFADGVVRPREFIAADQASSILAAIGHTIAMVRYTINRRHKE